MLRKLFYEYLKPVLNKVSHYLYQYGITPTQLTICGFIITVLGSLLFATGHLIGGALVILFAASFDMLDGPLARNTDQVSKFGGFIDSVIDRYSDFFIFGGLLIYYARTGQSAVSVLVLIVIAGAILTSYTKARAESLIKQCDVGIIERADRIVIICAAGIFNVIIPALWILAITTHFTAIQRIHFVWKKLNGSETPQKQTAHQIKSHPQT